MESIDGLFKGCLTMRSKRGKIKTKRNNGRHSTDFRNNKILMKSGSSKTGTEAVVENEMRRTNTSLFSGEKPKP